MQGRPIPRVCFNAVFSGPISPAGCILNHRVPRRLRNDFGNPVSVRSSGRFFEEDAAIYPGISGIALHVAEAFEPTAFTHQR
jgi:hypothetical protein